MASLDRSQLLLQTHSFQQGPSSNISLQKRHRLWVCLRTVCETTLQVTYTF